MHSILSTYNVHIANSKRQTEYNEKHKEADTHTKNTVRKTETDSAG